MATNPVDALRNYYSTDPYGYNLALQGQGDQESFGTPNFLGGPGGVIGHNMQTVFDAGNIQGAAQGGGTKYNMKAMPGQAPLDGLQGVDPINKWRQQKAMGAVQPQPSIGSNPPPSGLS